MSATDGTLAEHEQRLRAELASARNRIAALEANGNELLSRTERAEALLLDALHLRQHGERAPGGTESWPGWTAAAEAHLRGPGGSS